jgi:hypothetical protein
MNSKEKQIELIMKHLQENGSITSWNAISHYHITRLAAYIHVLRRRGFDIASIVQKNRHSWWVEYRLHGQPGLFDKVIYPPTSPTSAPRQTIDTK